MAVDGEPSTSDGGIPCPNGAVLHDIVIVGAGPCGLAVAARLRERNPAAIFTDEEHRRFHWMRRHGNKMALKSVRSGRVSGATHANRSGYNMVVLDANHDTWMGRWNHLFETFDIKHLRSPMFWHVDPNDRDSLLSKAYEQGRENELMEIKHCVGKEVSKHQKKKRGKYIGSKGDSRILINERDRHDYFNPTQSLFSDHCDEVVCRYGLQPAGLVRRERVLDISYAPVPGVSVGDERLFTVRTDKGVRHAPIVILAVGPGNQPRIPDIPGMTIPPASSRRTPSPSPSSTAIPAPSHAPPLQDIETPRFPFPPPQVTHAMQIQTFPSPHLQQKISARQPTSVLVIGGGLTSAQLSDLAIRRGATTVYHLARGPIRVRPFDVGLCWMGKFKNAEQSRFWQADTDSERLALLREARAGGGAGGRRGGEAAGGGGGTGSVTPQYWRVLRKHVESGRLKLFERTRIVGARFEASVQGEGERDGGGRGECEKRGGKWRVETEPEVVVDGVRGLPPVDWIYFATGVESDFATLPFLQTMLERYPIKGHGGFPCLNDDLMWQDGVPLFVAGRLAALKLGPSAPNLGGARLAAERIAWGIEEVVRKECGLLQSNGGREDEREGEAGLVGYVQGTGNMFRSLAEVSA